LGGAFRAEIDKSDGAGGLCPLIACQRLDHVALRIFGPRDELTRAILAFQAQPKLTQETVVVAVEPSAVLVLELYLHQAVVAEIKDRLAQVGLDQPFHRPHIPSAHDPFFDNLRVGSLEQAGQAVLGHAPAQAKWRRDLLDRAGGGSRRGDSPCQN